MLGAPFAADPAEHLKIGKGIGETCYQMYAKMGSGILSLLLLSIFFFGHWRDVLPNVCQNGLRYPFIVFFFLPKWAHVLSNVRRK